MGWNSWNTFYDHVDAGLLYSIADAMVDYGFRDAGYNYLILDDCWSKKQRDGQGNLVPDPHKFPDGMRAVSDYVHSKGLKFGIYSCCGVKTCAGYPGSFEHEFEDAALFAEWGVDYLKYDNGYRPSTLSTPLLYRRMSMALNSSGRDIALAACQWGTDEVHKWIRSSGAHTFRSTVDIQDSWDSISTIVKSQMDMQHCSGTGCFNDMDMLVVGMDGKGVNPETSICGEGGCTVTEYQTHFALWAMMNSPLIIGCDIRSASEAARGILLNQEVIAINQDPLCRSCYKLPVYANPDGFMLIRPLADGSYAVGFFNFGEKAHEVTLDFWDMGLPAHSCHTIRIRDCLAHKDLGDYSEFFSADIDAHGCGIYKVNLHAKIGTTLLTL
jgi:alpha-galactosidase